MKLESFVKSKWDNLCCNEYLHYNRKQKKVEKVPMEFPVKIRKKGENHGHSNSN